VTRLGGAALAAWLAILLWPDAAWAWGPATHIYVGTEILSALALLPPGVALLLRKHPFDFLYGCLAADITLGKKYAPIGRHCHHWAVGEEILDAADADALRATALGYLVHLAGDTVAHNTFVPRQLVLTAATEALGHSYWEHRMDVHLGEFYARVARRVVTDFDHRHSDELFDQVLARSLFSFKTNLRIFRGMIRLTDHETWQSIFDRVVDLSRWDLHDAEVRRYLRVTFNYSVDYLLAGDRSHPAQLDPVGEEKLLLAKRLRRRLAQSPPADEVALLGVAEEHFPFPKNELDYWDQRPEPRPSPETLLGSSPG
jgi:hypothetical protein